MHRCFPAHNVPIDEVDNITIYQAIDEVSDRATEHEGQGVEHESLIRRGLPVEIGNKPYSQHRNDQKKREAERFRNIAEHTKGASAVFHVAKIEKVVDNSDILPGRAHETFPSHILPLVPACRIIIRKLRKAFIEELGLCELFSALIENDCGEQNDNGNDKWFFNNSQLFGAFRCLEFQIRRARR